MSSQPTVLLVAYEPELLDVLSFELNRRGYRVLTACTGDGAVAIIGLELPSIAVLDMLLPGPSGFQITQILKERSEGRIPVVMISDLPAAAHRDYALAAGVDRFLEKWLAPTHLPGLIEALCPVPAEGRRKNSGSDIIRDIVRK